MKKILALLFVALLGTQTIAQAATVTPRTHAIVEKLNAVGEYVFSAAIIKDLAAAYCIGMGLTFIHEFGHALFGRLFYNAPIDITLGTSPSILQPTPIVQVGGVKLSGLNPATGYSSGIVPRAGTTSHPLKDAVIHLAGPVFGEASSLMTWILLKKVPGFYLTKSIAALGALNHIIGPAGLLGAGNPGHDLYKAAKNIQEYRNS